MEGAPHGTVTFLFTDVEGSTALWEQHSEAMRAALAVHDAIVRSVVAQHGGCVFSTAGDAFSAAFWTPDDAATAAVEIQRRLADAAWPEPIGLRVRMGLHTGIAEERDGDYFGPTLNRTARIMAAGHGGQVLVSAATSELLGRDALQDLGEHRLKDLATPERVYQLGAGGHPPLRTLDRVPHNLPVERTELFGREKDLETVTAVVRAHRLVTLVGIGGSGKTRLGLAAAAGVIGEFPDGVWLVDLVPVDQAERVPGAIADALGLRLDAHHSAMEILGVQLADRHLLLVLDNCEHITDAVADVVDELLDTTSAVRVLATSREPLDLPDEQVVSVPPLDSEGPFPPAVALFTARAARAGAAIPSEEDLTVREICRRLDGLPLAIELAAAQLVHLPPRELLDRLDRRFELLAAGRGRRHRRQSSLQAVLDSTWALLGEDERELLGRLAVFPATFDLDAVEGVCRSRSVPSPLSSLRGLVNRALVAVVNDVGGSTYRLLETVKLYALRRFGDDHAAAFRKRHFEWFAGRVVDTPAETLLTSVSFAGWYSRAYEDLRAASRHALLIGDLERASRIVAAGGVYWHFVATSRSLDGLERVDELLTANPSPAASARLHLAASLAGMGARSPKRMGHDSTVAVEEAMASDQPAIATMALCVSSWMPALRNPEAGLAILDQAERVATAAAMPRLWASANSYRGLFLGLAGRLEEAAELAYPLSLGYEGEPDYAVRNSLSALWAAVVLRDPDLATRASQAFRSYGQQSALAESWELLMMDAAADAAAGRFAEASWHLEKAAALARRGGADDGLPDLLLVPAIAAHRRGDARRGATLLRAIRDAGRPTQNFPVTIVYRQLRREWAAVEPEPTGEDLSLVFDEARRWLADIGCPPANQ